MSRTVIPSNDQACGAVRREWPSPSKALNRSFYAIHKDIVIFGEIGLAGEIRSVGEDANSEGRKAGFK